MTHPHSQPDSAAAMIERLIQAAVDYERAEGVYSAGARRELSEARKAVEDALARCGVQNESAPAPDQAWRDSDWLGLSASEKAGYHWPGDSDLHRQCRAAYIAGATDYASPPLISAPQAGVQSRDAVSAAASLISQKIQKLDCSRDECRLKGQSIYVSNLTKQIEVWGSHLAVLREVITTSSLSSAGCGCLACCTDGPHSSDCAVHNMPAFQASECTCKLPSTHRGSE